MQEYAKHIPEWLSKHALFKEYLPETNICIYPKKTGRKREGREGKCIRV